MSCTSKDDSKTKHDFGNMTPAQYKTYYWQELSSDDFDDYAAKTFTDNEFITEHLAIDYLQGWIDEIHKMVLASNPEIKIPKPRVVLQGDNQEVGGHLRSLPFCAGTEIVFSDAPASLLDTVTISIDHSHKLRKNAMDSIA